jgi:hypothetical protein
MRVTLIVVVLVQLLLAIGVPVLVLAALLKYVFG